MPVFLTNSLAVQCKCLNIRNGVPCRTFLAQRPPSMNVTSRLLSATYCAALTARLAYTAMIHIAGPCFAWLPYLSLPEVHR